MEAVSHRTILRIIHNLCHFFSSSKKFHSFRMRGGISSHNPLHIDSSVISFPHRKNSMHTHTHRKALSLRRNLTMDGQTSNASSQDNFENEVGNTTALVKFYAPWCYHCNTMASSYDRLAKRVHGNKIYHVSISIRSYSHMQNESHMQDASHMQNEEVVRMVLPSQNHGVKL